MIQLLSTEATTAPVRSMTTRSAAMIGEEALGVLIVSESLHFDITQFKFQTHHMGCFHDRSESVLNLSFSATF